MTAARKRKPAKLGRSTLANPSSALLPSWPVFDALRKEREPAIPPTLRRLERAAMRWFRQGRSQTQAQDDIALDRACAAHAEWKAKQRRARK